MMLTSPQPNHRQNVIDLDLEAIDVKVIDPCPFIHPPSLLPRKLNKAKKKVPLITLPGYSWVHEEVGSYANSFLTYESIIIFLKSVECCHVDRLDGMIIKSCLVSEHVFICASLGEIHFMYMYSTLLLNLHLIVPFDKFEVDAPCVLLGFYATSFFITLFASKFLHHYNVNENIKEWLDLPCRHSW